MNMYEQAQSKVKWTGYISDPFPVKQGVRQGGILSATLYKISNHDLLESLMISRLGTKIGYIPSAADDIALQSNSVEEAQYMLNCVGSYTKSHHFNINVGKSGILPIKSQDVKLSLYNKPLESQQTCEHLGIERNRK